VSIAALHEAATVAGKRLVLTGHSLGGAVAVLTTVRLLRALASGAALHSSSGGGHDTPPLLNSEAEPLIRCISFATPAVANTQLLQEVTAAGWDQFITNIVMPGAWRVACGAWRVGWRCVAVG
jgi:alpha-beta hydrolase superfamily lysophospholipase